MLEFLLKFPNSSFAIPTVVTFVYSHSLINTHNACMQALAESKRQWQEQQHASQVALAALDSADDKKKSKKDKKDKNSSV